jgi:solute carrier family 25 (mitochondrial carnitine/acylcarnitine transporter), member 20/29
VLPVAAAGAAGGALSGSLITFGSVRECCCMPLPGLRLTATWRPGVAFELVKVRRQLEFSIAAAKGVVIVKPPNTWESVKDIFRTRGPMGLYTGWPLHMRECH